MPSRLSPTLSLIAVILFTSSAAHAQWVFIARKSMGAIQNIRSEHSDVATVLLEAPADKVYAAAVRTLSGKEGASITRKDDASRTIGFTSNGQGAMMKVSSLEDKVSMLTITAGGTLRHSGDVSMVVNGVLRVCKQMNVTCSLSKE